MKKHLPLVELYSPMYRLVKYRTTTAATESEKKRNWLASKDAISQIIVVNLMIRLWNR